MKKLLWPLCVIAVLLSAAAGGFALAYLTEEVTFDQIKSSGYGFPDSPAHTITILHEGDYPGLSDFPVTAEQAAPGRAALNALRGQRYTRALPLLKPGKGGIAVREISGLGLAVPPLISPIGTASICGPPERGKTRGGATPPPTRRSFKKH